MKHIYFFIFFLISTFAFAQLTPPAEQSSYYNGIDFNTTGIALKNALATKTISKHTNFLSYSEVWEALKITDEDSDITSNVLLIYGWDNSGNITEHRSRNKNLNGGSVGDWNREHTYPKSLGNPDLGTTGPGSDAQMLRPSDVQRNSSRGNQKFADKTTGQYTNGESGNVTGGWYPGDEWKGDCARIIMYMYLRYGSQCLPTNVGIGSNATTPDDMIDLFLQWNTDDPVVEDGLEDVRNNYHANTSNSYAQGNRNPFIDNPYLATVIWGGNAAENRWATADNENPSDPTNLVASSPTDNSIDLTWTASTDNVAVTSYDIYVDDVNTYNSTTNSFTATGLSANTNYCFTVVAKDAAGNESGSSNEDCEMTTDDGSSGGDCASEDFEGIPANSGSYATRTWTGVDGIPNGWTATDARTDETLNGRAICVRNGTLTSPSISGGIGNLTVTTQLTFSGSAGTFDVLINGSSVGSIPYSGDNTTPTTTTISNINITGNISIVLDNQSTSNRVRIDDLSWTCYASMGIDESSLSSIKFYPNPLDGNTLYFETNQFLVIEIFNVLGKLIISDDVNTGKNNLNLSNLSSGIYLVKISNSNQSITKKLIKQ